MPSPIGGAFKGPRRRALLGLGSLEWKVASHEMMEIVRNCLRSCLYSPSLDFQLDFGHQHCARSMRLDAPEFEELCRKWATPSSVSTALGSCSITISETADVEL